MRTVTKIINQFLFPETNLKKEVEVIKILRILTKKFCELRPWAINVVGMKTEQS
jgi:hypothetical protein